MPTERLLGRFKPQRIFNMLPERIRRIEYLPVVLAVVLYFIVVLA